MKNSKLIAGRTRILAGLLGSAALVAACGGGGDDDTPQAEDLVPDLDDMGMAVQQEGEVVEDMNTYRVIFGGEDGGGVLTDIRVMETEETAEAEFAQLSEALQTPPQEFLGADVEQETAETIGQGDEQTAYVTAEPDGSGNRVWTDLYRDGPVLLITQTLSADEAAAQDTRETVAERVLSEVE